MEIYRLLQEIDENDNGFHNSVCGMTYDEYRNWLQKEYGYDTGKLEDWMVPQTSYWLMDGETPVGYGRLRHALNENLAKSGGHIGYAIAKSQRGKGYGNQILALLLEECRAIGIWDAQIATNENNVRSQRVILKNGGRFVRGEDGKRIYRIRLSGASAGDQ